MKEEEYWLQLRHDIDNEPKTELEHIIEKYADKNCENSTYEEWIEAVIVIGNMSDQDTSKVGLDGFWELEKYRCHMRPVDYWDKEEDY